MFLCFEQFSTDQWPFLLFSETSLLYWNAPFFLSKTSLIILNWTGIYQYIENAKSLVFLAVSNRSMTSCFFPRHLSHVNKAQCSVVPLCQWKWNIVLKLRRQKKEFRQFPVFWGSPIHHYHHHPQDDDQGGPQLAGPYQAIRQTASTSRCSRVRAPHTALLVPSSI